MFAGRSRESMRWAERALELPRTESVTLMALHLRGNARGEAGDLGGVEDLRKALEVAEASGMAIDIVTSHSYLLEWVGLEDGPSAGLPMNRATVDLCARRGIEGQGMWTRAEGFWLRFDAGLWDDLLDETSDLPMGGRTRGHADRDRDRPLQGRVLAHRGDARRRGRTRRDLRAGCPTDRGPAGAGAALVVAAMVACRRRRRRTGRGARRGVRRRDEPGADGVPGAPPSGGRPRLLDPGGRLDLGDDHRATDPCT